MELRLWPGGWYSGWMVRSYPGLAYYLTLAFVAMTLAVASVVVVGVLTARRAESALRAGDHATSDRMNKRLLSLFWMLGLLQMAYLMPGHLLSSADITSNLFRIDPYAGDEGDIRLSWWSFIHIPYVLFVCLASLGFIPTFQVLFIKRQLIHLRNQGPLHPYIPHARLVSTIIGLAWNASFYCMGAFWLPHTSAALWKYVVVQGAFGSAFTWHVASDLFTLHVEKLEHQDEKVCRGAWGGVARLFGNPEKVGEAGEAGASPLLSV